MAGMVGAAEGFRLRRGDPASPCARGALAGAPAFDRRAAFFDTRFSAAWIAALAGALAHPYGWDSLPSSTWTTPHQLWWQFELRGEASRFLRASVGAALALLLFALARLVGHAPHDAPVPTDADLVDAGRRSRRSRRRLRSWSTCGTRRSCSTTAGPRSSCYVQGRTWVALENPVGPEPSCPAWSALSRAVRRFRRRARLL